MKKILSCLIITETIIFLKQLFAIRGGDGTSYNGLYREAPPQRGTSSTLQAYERVGISRVEVHERVGKSVI